MDTLGVGIIGTGWVSGEYIRAFSMNPHTEIVAICSRSKERAAAKAAEYDLDKCTFVTDPEDMMKLPGIDIVCINTPNFLHAPLTIKALEAGCHVLCEKPMAMDVNQAETMKNKADELGKTLMINFSYRFLDETFALKEQISKGVIGDIYYVRTAWHRRKGFPGVGGWFGQKDKSGGGPLIDLGVHRIDLALFLMVV